MYIYVYIYILWSTESCCPQLHLLVLYPYLMYVAHVADATLAQDI